MQSASSFLVVTGDSLKGYKISITQAADQALRKSKKDSVRVSPIFRVDSANSKVVLSDGMHIGVLSPLNAFKFIGSQPKEVKKNLWFSVGIPSVINFSESHDKLDGFIQQSLPLLAAYEIWKVGANQTLQILNRYVREVPLPNVSISSYKGLTADSQRLLEEIRLHLHEALRTAATFLPEQVQKLECIAKAANQIAAEIYYFEDPANRPPPNHLRIGAEEVTSYQQNQRLNQGLTHLIQLNSALAYVVSQTSHASTPILDRPCLASSHSLLGVGTAYRAVGALAGFVEQVFEGTPVLATIAQRYQLLPGVEIERALPEYQVSMWGTDIANTLDLQMSGMAPEKIRPKLAFFSSRLGFGEAHFSITCATQVLHAADSVRWSLATLTHELLHSHVTGLLSTIFAKSQHLGLNQNLFEQYHEDLLAWQRGAEKPKSLLDTIRFVIFSFAAGRRAATVTIHNKEHSKGQTTPVPLSVEIPTDAGAFTEVFQNSMHLMEEIAVHTLDLHYFYNGDKSLFLEVLWESWTTVPAVVGDLQQYLLRCVVACATTDRSPSRRTDQRVEASVDILKGKLSELVERSPANLFVKKARAELECPRTLGRIRLLFTPCIYLADMFATLLFSATVQTKFWSGDRKIDPDEDASTYLLDTLEFSGGEVKNPVAFLMDRVRRQMKPSSWPEEHRSAWTLLATASSATT